MWCHEGNHFPAVIETGTGHRGRAFDHPSLGRLGFLCAWAPPTKTCRRLSTLAGPSSPVQLTGGYLGASVAATPFQPGDTPIPNLLSAEGQQRRRARAANADAARGFEQGVPRCATLSIRDRGALAVYELAARMQLSAPEVVDFANEPKQCPGSLRHRRKRNGRFWPAASAGAAPGGKGRPVSSRFAMPAAATAAGTRTAI